MIRFSFRKGLRFTREERIWTVERRLMDGTLRLEADDGELLNASEAEILAGCTQGTWQVDPTGLAEPLPLEARIPRDLSSFSEKAQAGACRRQVYLNRLMANGPLISSPDKLKEQIIAVGLEIGDNNPPSPVTVYRWSRRFSETQDIVDLADRRETQGRRIAWPREVKVVVEDAIETIFLNPQKNPAKAVYEETQRRCLQLQKSNPTGMGQLRIPSRSSIYRYLKNLERYTVDAARLGRPAANRKYREVFGKQKTERVLERWEIDHTPLDLIVYDEETRLPHGRPWLTVAIDKYSRMVMGFYIGFGNPSAYSVLQCIRQAILPKQELLRQYVDITLPWPARGIPEMIVCDNGMELHSGSFIKACQELNIQIQFCPAKLPEYKGSIERFFRTISQDLIHRLPGTTFSNIRERGDYASEKTACVGFKTLNKLLFKWIVEIYHQETHRGIGMPPAMKWEMGERERIIEYPACPDQLRVIMGHTAERTLFRYGLEINGLKYNCTELQALYRRYGNKYKLTLKFYEDDVAFIHVFDPTEKSYIRTPATDQEYVTGLTLDQHELIRLKLREEARDYTDLSTLLAKKQELQAMIESAIHHKKMGVRKNGSHLRHINSVHLDGIEPKGGDAQLPVPPPPLPLTLANDKLPEFQVSKNKLYGDDDSDAGKDKI